MTWNDDEFAIQYPSLAGEIKVIEQFTTCQRCNYTTCQYYDYTTYEHYDDATCQHYNYTTCQN